jgi:hypothetical protein
MSDVPNLLNVWPTRGDTCFVRFRIPRFLNQRLYFFTDAEPVDRNFDERRGNPESLSNSAN